MPFESTRKEPRVEFCPTSTTVAPADPAAVGALVASTIAPVGVVSTGEVAAIVGVSIAVVVSVGITGVAVAQAERITVRRVKLESKNLFFI
jgi:hypothetical protein